MHPRVALVISILLTVACLGWAQSGSIPQRTLVRVLEAKAVLLEMPVTFPAFSADLSNPDGMVEGLNRKTIEAVAELLSKKGHPGITVVAHSDASFAADRDKAEDEQNNLLIPLSRARAQALVDALVGTGLDPSWFVISGRGADAPLVALDDEENSWKNRRIEIDLAP